VSLLHLASLNRPVLTAGPRYHLAGMSSRSDGTAFVLSGGASLGACRVGMLHAHYEREIGPDVIVGTSVAAINGAFIASHPQMVQTACGWRRSGEGCGARKNRPEGVAH